MKKAILSLLLVFTFSVTSFAQLSITGLNQTHLINFDFTVPNVNNGSFSATGYSPLPQPGELDSDAFAILGFVPSLNFGDTRNTGQYSNGVSVGNVNTVGLYAFETSVNNKSLGFQANGSYFDPGAIILRIINNTGGPINSFTVAYTLYILNNGNNGQEIELAHSKTGATYLTEPNSSLITPGVAASSPSWNLNVKTIQFNTVDPLLDGEEYLIRWNHELAYQNAGGGYDEIALDDISITASTNVASIREDELQNSVRLIPNFGDGRFEIKNEANVKVTSVEVFNIQGAMVKNVPLTQGVNAVDIGALAEGTYIVKVITEKGVLIKKYLKN